MRSSTGVKGSCCGMAPADQAALFKLSVDDHDPAFERSHPLGTGRAMDLGGRHVDRQRVTSGHERPIDLDQSSGRADDELVLVVTDRAQVAGLGVCRETGRRKGRPLGSAA